MSILYRWRKPKDITPKLHKNQLSTSTLHPETENLPIQWAQNTLQTSPVSCWGLHWKLTVALGMPGFPVLMSREHASPGLGRGKHIPSGKCWTLMLKDTRKIRLLPGVHGHVPCKICTWGFQAAQHRAPLPSGSWVKLWGILASSCTSKNQQSLFSLWAGALVFFQDNPTKLLAQSNIPGISWLGSLY